MGRKQKDQPVPTYVFSCTNFCITSKKSQTAYMYLGYTTLVYNTENLPTVSLGFSSNTLDISTKDTVQNYQYYVLLWAVI